MKKVETANRSKTVREDNSKFCRAFYKKRKEGDGVKQRVSEKSVLVWRIRTTLVLFGSAFVLGGLFAFFPILSSIVGTMVVIAYAFVITVYCPALYRNTSFCVDGDRITIEHGFFVRTRCTLRAERVQYIITINGPVQRIFGLCSLSFMTAGSAEILQNVTHEDAEKIKKALGKD